MRRRASLRNDLNLRTKYDRRQLGSNSRRRPVQPRSSRTLLRRQYAAAHHSDTRSSSLDLSALALAWTRIHFRRFDFCSHLSQLESASHELPAFLLAHTIRDSFNVAPRLLTQFRRAFHMECSHEGLRQRNWLPSTANRWRANDRWTPRNNR